MIQNLLIMANRDILESDARFEKTFRSIGEFVEELSHLYSILKERPVDMILIPENFPGINSGTVNRIRMRNPLADIWVISNYRDSANNDYTLFDGVLNLSDGNTEISKKIKRILYLKELLRNFNIIGRSEKMKIIAETIERIAPTDISVLIIGPSGSGKELIARAIHTNSSKSSGKFVAINCGALSAGVLESELFGHEKGAFTGSIGKRNGLFVQADNGTIFLDEIGETKPDMQVKLLRVLEDGYFYPVGGDKPVRSNARVIAATNRDLSEAIGDGNFREDLYFRLGVIKITLPPLYDRRGDILPLLFHFAKMEGLKGFSDKALDLLMRYDWYGNVRQLKNFVSRMSALRSGKEISEKDVESFIAEQYSRHRALPVVTGHTAEDAGHELIYHALLQLGNEIKMLRELILMNLPSQTEFEEESIEENEPSLAKGTVKDMEKTLIKSVLEKTGGNRKLAARQLGMGERTLYRKLKEYNLS
ncbi:MAG: sigma-54 dependent transcriptional regulator [Candidatus Zixiibacteriota bacterium]